MFVLLQPELFCRRLPIAPCRREAIQAKHTSRIAINRPAKMKLMFAAGRQASVKASSGQLRRRCRDAESLGEETGEGLLPPCLGKAGHSCGAPG